MARIVLGVTGGIAAYKAVSLLRLLVEAGHQVTVVPTKAALNFIGAATWAAISGQPVSTEVWSCAHEVPHVRLGQGSDLVLVAPATADFLARAAQGRCDDLLAATLLTARCPLLIAPAMHTEMWEHPATAANVALLRQRGALVCDPAVGRLTGADSGSGRLPEPENLFHLAQLMLTKPPSAADQDSALLQAAGQHRRDLLGVRVLISAGGTREAIDPVRFIGNRSSGKQGYALALTAQARGAEVTLVHTGTALPAGVTQCQVTTAAELRIEMQERSTHADVIVMAAAVADFTPINAAPTKVKKQSGDQGFTLEMNKNPDILQELCAGRRDGQVIVGFAAETGDSAANALDYGRAKLAAKGVDLLVVNDVSGGQVFGAEDTAATIMRAQGEDRTFTGGSKLELAQVLWDCVLQQTSRVAN